MRHSFIKTIRFLLPRGEKESILSFPYKFFLMTVLTVHSFTTDAIPPIKSRDPTMPAIIEQNGNMKEWMRHYVLNSIITSSYRNLALINNRLVRPGDMIGKAQVKEIHSNDVILLIDNQSVKINLIDKTDWDVWR